MSHLKRFAPLTAGLLVVLALVLISSLSMGRQSVDHEIEPHPVLNCGVDVYVFAAFPGAEAVRRQACAAAREGRVQAYNVLLVQYFKFAGDIIDVTSTR